MHHTIPPHSLESGPGEETCMDTDIHVVNAQTTTLTLTPISTILTEQ